MMPHSTLQYISPEYTSGSSTKSVKGLSSSICNRTQGHESIVRPKAQRCCMPKPVLRHGGHGRSSALRRLPKSCVVCREKKDLAHQAAFCAICAPICHGCCRVQEHLEADLHSQAAVRQATLLARDSLSKPIPGISRRRNAEKATFATLSAVSLKSTHFPVFDFAKNSSMSLMPML